MMNPEVKQKWITALRSGNYPQGIGALNKDNEFCCLGVLCEVMNVTKKEESYVNYYLIGYGQHSRMIPDDFMGIGFDMKNRLADMNDDGRTFEFIADYIEKNL